MSKELESLTLREALADLVCYALGSSECDEKVYGKRKAEMNFNIIQQEQDILKLALEVLDIIVNDMHFHHVFNEMKLVFKRTVKEDRFNKVEKFLENR